MLMLVNADNMIANYKELNGFVKFAPWNNLYSSNVKNILCDEDSLKDKIDSLTLEIDNSPVNQPGA